MSHSSHLLQCLCICMRVGARACVCSHHTNFIQSLCLPPFNLRFPTHLANIVTLFPSGEQFSAICFSPQVIMWNSQWPLIAKLGPGLQSLSRSNLMLPLWLYLSLPPSWVKSSNMPRSSWFVLSLYASVCLQNYLPHLVFASRHPSHSGWAPARSDVSFLIPQW